MAILLWLGSAHKRTPYEGTVIAIWSRRSTILPQFVGCDVVYNGKKHIPVIVTEMIRRKFDEFAPTVSLKLMAATKRKPLTSRG